MKKTGTMLTVILLSVVLTSCATTGSSRKVAENRQILKSAKTVSILTFECSDPVIANEVRNKIIEVLLADYSVMTGEGADLTIKGSILLTGTGEFISEIHSQIVNKSGILAAAYVSQESSPAPHDVMGRKIGSKIRDILIKRD